MADLIEPRFDARGDSNYDPCVIGLHLCGIATHPTKGEQPYTALNIPAADHAAALAMFEAAKAEASCAACAADFVCDLNLGSRQAGVAAVDDFWTNRQLADRLIAAAASATAPDREKGA